jgi:hypothetical protein
MKLTYLGFVAALLAVTACSSPPPVPVANIALVTPTATQTAPPVGIVLVATTLPTATPHPTATATATPTPHPLTIQSMRERVYQVSEVTIEETLQPGRIIAAIVSYLSEGLNLRAAHRPNGENLPRAGP